MTKGKISYQDIIKRIKPDLENTINFLERELQGIRTSRVNPAFIENLEVECFGQKVLLKQLGTILVSGPRELSIQVWDNSYIEPITKTLERKSLGTTPLFEKKMIKIVFPPLSEEFRKDLLKLVSQKKEEARQKVRRLREEAWGKIQTAFRESKISEDEKYKGKDELQDLVDEYNKKIDESVAKKEKEILEE